MPLLYRDLDGSAVYADYDPSADKLTMRRRADVEPVLEEARRAFNGPVNQKSEFRRVMSIPQDVAMIWGKEQGFGEDWYARIFGKGNEEVLARLVHDRNLSLFRTMPGDFTGSFRRR